LGIPGRIVRSGRKPGRSAGDGRTGLNRMKQTEGIVHKPGTPGGLRVHDLSCAVQYTNGGGGGGGGVGGGGGGGVCWCGGCGGFGGGAYNCNPADPPVLSNLQRGMGRRSKGRQESRQPSESRMKKPFSERQQKESNWCREGLRTAAESRIDTNESKEKEDEPKAKEDWGNRSRRARRE